MMNKIKYSRSGIGIIIAILITIFPITQILLFTLNGGLTYLFAIPFGAKTKSGVTQVSSVVVNTVLSIAGIFIFYFANKTWVKIVSTFLIMFAGQMLMLFLTDEFNLGDKYLLTWLFVGGIPALIISILSLTKSYTKDK